MVFSLTIERGDPTKSRENDFMDAFVFVSKMMKPNASFLLGKFWPTRGAFV